MEINQSLYTDNYNNFDEWLELILADEKVYPQFRIPYDEWLENYIADIKNRSLEDVKKLLRCLLTPI